MARDAVTISFRLGGDDGVAVEARKWAGALEALGFTTRRIAGAIEDGGRADDQVITGLAIDATEPVEAAALSAAIGDADLVVVDNICSLPLNLDAARTVAKVVGDSGARIVFRHHDLPWQRRALTQLENEFPPRVEGALHATINLRSRRELQARGYEHATTIHNYFDLAPAARRSRRHSRAIRFRRRRVRDTATSARDRTQERSRRAVASRSGCKS